MDIPNFFWRALVVLMMTACAYINGKQEIAAQASTENSTGIDTEIEPEKTFHIKLAGLASTTSQEVWQQFFEERGAELLWGMLKELNQETSEGSIQHRQKFNSSIAFELRYLEEAQVAMEDQVDQVVAGIIEYLAYYIPSVSSLFIIGESDNSQNQLHNLPSSIGKLTNLTCLSLSDNALTKLPSEIGQLRELKEFHLDNNQLNELPISLLQLNGLKKIHIVSNQLTVLPEGFSSWFVGKQVLADDNPWITREQCERFNESLLNAYPYKQNRQKIACHLNNTLFPRFFKAQSSLPKRLQLCELMQGKRIIYFEESILCCVPFYLQRELIIEETVVLSKEFFICPT